ncbi:MAG: MFS transporter [Dehalococcoidia bacterium]|jgi:MFS family permease|nr:MFS transporter [Dehalococcoidia bacterium]
MPDPPNRGRRIFYGWWLAGVAATVMALGNVPFFQGTTIWNPVMEAHFEWGRGQMSWAFALARAEGGLLGPVEGLLIQRLGPRRMVLNGLIILGGGFVILGNIQQLWHLYVSFLVMSLGVGLGTWLPVMTALNSWFIRRRATAMGIAMEGFSLGGVFLIPVIAWAIGSIEPGEPERFGWRATAQGIGFFLMALAFPISRLVRNRPEEYGQRPDGDSPELPPVVTQQAEAPPPGSEARDLTWQQAVRTRAFWLITIGHAGSTSVIVTVAVHLGLMLGDRGFSLQMVGWVVSTYTAVGALFTLVGGYVGDRVPIRITLFGFSAIQSVAIAILFLNESVYIAFVFAMLMGIGFGGRIPLTTAIRGVYFGRRAFAAITGISMLPMNLFLVAAPLFAGYMFDYTGSYAVPFTTVAVICFLGSTMFLLLGKPPAPELVVD